MNKTQPFTRKKIEDYSYGLSDIIGKGYSSQVYKGRHDNSQEPVAVKVIDMKMLKNEINRHLLESEIQILKDVKHVSHVLKFHEVYTTKNNTYIITELCSSDLTKKVDQKLTEAQAFQFMDQIIEGYLQIYQKQIVHRDLKPANILLTENDECKIADFGFAIKQSELSKPSKYNVGSPLYMAPESLKNNEYSYKTDIWSLGVIFFELLTGETPWKSSKQAQLLKKIETQKIETIIQKRRLSFCPKAIEFLVKCLSIDVSRRLDPEELRKYTFSTKMPKNVLTDAKPNNQNNNPFKSLKLINTSLASIPSSKIPQKYIFNPIRTPSSKQISSNTSLNTTVKFNQAQQLSSNKINENKKESDKQISKQLLTEIHFCRFLFKLIQKIKESVKRGILKQLVEQAAKVQRKFTQFIRHKMSNLTSFDRENFLDVEESVYIEYKSCTDFKKIMKIARQYSERYEIELKQHWDSPFDKRFTTGEILSLVKKMIETLQGFGDGITGELTAYENDVISLDYLITAKQLVSMLEGGQNYEKFARKSKIEEILDGTTSMITSEMYNKIIERGRLILNQ